ncbi:MAG: tol-pal system protein YbgF [Pseudomonadota bacterium]
MAGSPWPMRAVACLMVSGAVLWGPASALAQSAETGELQKRVQQLEQQLVDMQVVIGTLESLAGSGAAGGAGSAPVISGGGYGGGNFASGAGADSARLDTMETQIRALSAQMEQLSRQMGAATGGGRRGDAVGGQPYGGASNYASTEPRFRGSTASQAPVAGGGFGSTTITPADGGGALNDPIGGYLSGGAGGQPAEPSLGAGGWNSSASQQVARAPIGTDDTKSIYETAYGYLLQQDYTSAESAFGDFVKRFPQDQLASNAQYWLGETYFVRGQYKSAAGAFLKGYEDYRSGSKAPDSLLKLAMSLEKLGQKDAACSSLSELTVRFPQAPAHVKRKAQSERSRFGC